MSVSECNCVCMYVYVYVYICGVISTNLDVYVDVYVFLEEIWHQVGANSPR